MQHLVQAARRPRGGSARVAPEASPTRASRRAVAFRSLALILWLGLILAGPTVAQSPADALANAVSLLAAGEESAGEAALLLLAENADATDDLRSRALALLGGLAAQRGDLPAAARYWSEAVAEFAGTEGALHSETQLRLTGRGPVPDTMQGPPPGRVDAPIVQETPVEGDLGLDEPKQPVGVVPGPSERTTAAQPSAGSSRVLIAAEGRPYDAMRAALERLEGHLRDAGVDIGRPTDAIPIVQESASTVVSLANRARELGATSVLLLEGRFGFRERVKLTCYTAGGQVLWSEKVSGGTGDRTTMSRSTSSGSRAAGMNAKLMERLEAKLERHLGGPGLPTS